MESGIRINLFGNFEIKKNGEPILESISNTRKTKLFLAYLVLNKERLIPHKELFELLWSGQEYSNPGTALRTLLYRYRNLIADNGYDELSDSVISRRGAYQWNLDINVSIDIDDFEEYSSIGLNTSLSREKRAECLKKAIELYEGPLLNEFSGEHWIVQKAVHYRDLFLSDIAEYVQLLKEDNRADEALKVLNEAINKSGHSDIVDMNISLINEGNLSSEGNSRYMALQNQSDLMSKDIDVLQTEMEDEDIADSAFVCDFKMFKDVFHLQRRLLARTGETMFVSLLTVGVISERDEDSLTIERTMKALLESTKKCLRCGDSICRYSDSCLAVMFPAGTYEDAGKIMERIRNRFLSSINNSEEILISYRVRPLKNVKD